MEENKYNNSACNDKHRRIEKRLGIVEESLSINNITTEVLKNDVQTMKTDLGIVKENVQMLVINDARGAVWRNMASAIVSFGVSAIFALVMKYL